MAGIAGGFISLLLALLMGTTFTYTYDTATPVGTDAPSTLDDQDRNTKLAIQERVNVDHYWTLTGTQASNAATGEHRKISFYNQIADPTNAADKGWLYMKDVAANTELFWEDEAGNVLQLSSVGTINISASGINGTLANDTYWTAVDFAGTGTVDLIKADVNDVAVIPDNSQTATNAAPTSSTGIVNKKYVDDQQHNAAFSPTSYTGGETTTYPNGLIMKMGSDTMPTAVTFAAAFPNAIVSVTATYTSTFNNAVPLYVVSSSTAAFTVQVMQDPTGEETFNWIAIGY